MKSIDRVASHCYATAWRREGARNVLLLSDLPRVYSPVDLPLVRTSSGCGVDPCVVTLPTNTLSMQLHQLQNTYQSASAHQQSSIANAMDPAQSSSNHTSQLLSLPPEIRELILQELLGPDIIAVQCAVPNSSDRLPKGNSYGFTGDVPHTTSPVHHRSKWELKQFYPYRTINLSYQLDPLIRQSGWPVSLQILQVCKQLHAEGHRLLYRHRTFSFTSSFPIPTAAMFFADRSSAALGLIQSVELRVAELQDSSYSMRGDYPPDNKDYSGLKWTMDLYPRLCEILASPPVKLEKLTLVVEGWYFYMGSRPASFPTIEQLARGEGFEPTRRAQLKTGDEPAVWIDPLLTITGLKTLSVCWPLTAPTIQRELETILLMRQHMLRNGAHAKKSDDLQFSNHVLSRDSRLARGSVAWYTPSTKSFRVQDDTRTMSESGSELLDRELHRVVVQSLLENFEVVRFCMFELNATDF